MSDNSIVALLGAAIIIGTSIIAPGASGSDAMNTCFSAVTQKCSHTEHPTTCTQDGVRACHQTHTTNTAPAPAKKRRPPNREFVLQGTQ